MLAAPPTIEMPSAVSEVHRSWEESTIGNTAEWGRWLMVLKAMGIAGDGLLTEARDAPHAGPDYAAATPGKWSLYRAGASA
jgi:hypothetical protein